MLFCEEHCFTETLVQFLSRASLLLNLLKHQLKRTPTLFLLPSTLGGSWNYGHTFLNFKFILNDPEWHSM